MELQKIETTNDLALISESASRDVVMIKESNFDNDTKQVMLRAIAIRFCDLSKVQQVQVITTELEQAFIRNGQEKDGVETKAFTVAEIVDLFAQRKQITHKEVSHIFRQGSLGLYGKNYGINVKAVNDWIHSFYEDEARKLAIRKLNDLKKQSEAIRELTPAEKESVMVKMVKEIYYERTQNGFDGMEMLSFPVYDILKVKGLIKLSERQKDDLVEEAKDLIERAKFKKNNSSIEPITANMVYAIIQQDEIKVAKVLAVRDYFNELSQRNMELPL